MSKNKQYKDPNGQHIRLYKIVSDSPAWKCLSTSAKALWLDLRVQTQGFNNGTATTALGILSHYGWASRHTVMRARDELEILGFIEQTQKGGLCNGGKTPHLYRFTDLEMVDLPKYQLKAKKADHLYRCFKTHQDARTALSESRFLKRKKRKVQNLPIQSTETTPRVEKLSAEFVH